jgi:glucose/arabinose dehydrogenase
MAKLLILLISLLFSLQSLWGDSLVRLETIAQDLDDPVFVGNAGDGSGRLFFVEQSGRIVIFRDGAVLAEPFLDISSRVTSGGERGLLGVAFHPSYSSNGRFFVNYTQSSSGQLKTLIAEYQRSATEPDRADISSERVLLEIDQPFNNHNGGMLAFGPDGYLYISVGDGGAAGDPQNNGQSLSTLLGKILRIDVDQSMPYSIPVDNPFVGIEGARDEIWAYGLRNVWRFSFDEASGRLFAGDVGQADWEEVDLITRGGNFGWNRMEGNHCYPPGTVSCDTTGLILPIAEFDHSLGQSVTGGYVYRGGQNSPLLGSYIFGDYVSGRVWSLTERGDGSWVRQEILRTDYSISSFGQGEDNELYLVDYSGGQVFKMVFSWREVLANAADGSISNGTFHSRIVFVNNENIPVSGNLQFYSSDGQLASMTIGGVTATAFPFSVNGRSSTVLETDAASAPLFVGWAEVFVDGEVSSTLQYILKNVSGKPVAEAGIQSSPPAQRLTGSVYRDRTLGLDTGIAIVNPSPTERVQISLVVRDENDEVAITVGAQMEPRQHSAGYLSELGELPDQFVGTILIDASAKVSATLISTIDGVHSASLPFGQ